jgi:hypothetical protein
MIPQGYALQIVGSDEKRYMIVGWRDYDDTFRPVVVPLDERDVVRAFTLSEDIVWRIRTWA